MNRLSIRYQSSHYKSVEEIIKYERQEQEENRCLALGVVFAGSSVVYYHHFRKLSPVVSGSASPQRMFAGHTASIQAVVFSPVEDKGELIAGAGQRHP